MKHSPKLRFGIVFIAVILGFRAGSGELQESREEYGPSRAVTLDEIQQIFDLAIHSNPDRCRLIAEIDLKSSALPLPQANPRIKTAATHKSLRVQEWYSGQYYRLDQTDKVLATVDEMETNSCRYQKSYVNIQDAEFCPYPAFEIDHELHRATVFKIHQNYPQYDLRQVLGFDEVVLYPLILALADLTSVDIYVTKGLSLDLRYAKLDAQNAKQLCEGSYLRWQFRAADGKLDGVAATRLQLDGKYITPAPRQLCSAQITLWLGHIAGKLVCLQNALTNLTEHTSFFSKREQFDDRGLPGIWTTTTLDKRGVTNNQTVFVKEIEIAPAFTDEEIFKPSFPTNYLVMESGYGTVTQIYPWRPEGEAGIGTMLTLRKTTQEIQIKFVKSNSPAQKAGLKAGLIVQKVDDLPTKGMTVEKCVSLIRGQPDTKVRLELVDSDRNTTNTVELNRKKIN